MARVPAPFLVLCGLLGACWGSPPVDPSLYASLRDPSISSLPDQRVLQVVVPGKAQDAAATGIGLLFKAWFTLGVDGAPPAPRGRWPADPATPEDQWVGILAMPIPDSVTALPDPPSKDGHTVELATWTYGEVAQILHEGSYDTEPPTVQRLHDFIQAQGYRISGLHEEEYVKGPGMFFRGDPAKYLTVIRYPVQKVADAAP